MLKQTTRRIRVELSGSTTKWRIFCLFAAHVQEDNNGDDKRPLNISMFNGAYHIIKIKNTVVLCYHFHLLSFADGVSYICRLDQLFALYTQSCLPRLSRTLVTLDLSS